MKHTEEINEKKQHQEGNKIALNKSHKWKSPTMLKIPNFWISSLSKGHAKLALILLLLLFKNFYFVFKATFTIK